MFEYDRINKAAVWNKNDGRLVLGVFLLGLLFLLLTAGGAAGAEAVVTVNGRETARYSLSEDGVYLLQGDGGANTLQLRDGSVRILQADCPDLICVDQGWISKAGQSLICLPHKLAVTVQGRGAPEPETDAMAQ